MRVLRWEKGIQNSEKNILGTGQGILVYFNAFFCLFGSFLHKIADCQLSQMSIILFVYLFIYWPRHMACGILVSWPGIEPVPPVHWKHGVLTTGPPGKSLFYFFIPSVL